MLFRLSVFLLILCSVSAVHVFAQADSPQAAPIARPLSPGIVVDLEDEGNDAWIAGVRPGDVLLKWNRGNESGDITSPFDLSWVELSQKPFGKITLRGSHNAEPKSWTLGNDLWFLQARPNFSPASLAVYEKAIQLVKDGKASEAEALWPPAFVALSPGERDLVSCWLYFRAAKLMSDARKWDHLDEYYQKAFALVPESRTDIGVSVLNAWAGASLRRNNLADAENIYRRALAESHKSAYENLMRANTLLGLGNVEIARGQPLKAEEYLRESLSLREKLVPGSMDYAVTLRNLANVERLLANLMESERLSRQALDIYERLAPNDVSVAAMYLTLGVVARQHGDLTQAESYFRRSVQLHQSMGARGRGLSIGFSGLGNIALERDDFETAQYYHEKALAISQELNPNGTDTAISLSNLGTVARGRGDLVLAQAQLQQALSISEKIGPTSLETSWLLGELGTVRYLSHDMEGALSYYNKSLAIRVKKTPGSLEEAILLSSLGSVAKQKNDLSAAEDYNLRALAIREKTIPGSSAHGESLAALADIKVRQQQTDSALKLFARAIDAFESQTARLGGAEGVRTDFRASLIDSYQQYAGLLIMAGQPDLAFTVLERSRARTLLETLAEAHADIRGGVDPKLLEQERSLRADIAAKTERHIRLAADKADAKSITDVETETSSLLKQYQDVEGQIRSGSPVYAALTQPQPLTAAQVQKQLLDDKTLLLEYSLGEERSYVFAVTATSLNVYQIPKRSEIEALARPVYKILTSRNSPEKGETASARLDRVRNDDRRYPEAAQKLSQAILGPVADQLKGKRLIIVSDGILQYLPFAALPEPAQTPLHASLTRPPLVRQHEIVNLPSATVLQELRREAASRPRPAKTVAILADPVFNADDSRVNPTNVSHVGFATDQAAGKTEHAGITADIVSTPAADQIEASASLAQAHLLRSENDVRGSAGNSAFSRLLYSRHEADSISLQVPAGESMKALDFKATRIAASDPALAQYRIVHFATHGLLNSQHPELSGLVFSMVDENGKPQNGFLEMADIYNLHLPIDMAVLSACETGLGKEIKGEGLLGLTRGFMHAGATRVVASLWKVNDAATAELMGRFYKGILKDKLEPAAALQRAQLEMSKKQRWSAAYYWAGFVIQGEW